MTSLEFCPKSCTEIRSIAPPSPRTSRDSSKKKKVGDEEKPSQSWSLRCFLLKKKGSQLEMLLLQLKKIQINKSTVFFLRCWSVVTNQPIWSTNPTWNPEFRTPACARANWAPASREPRSTQRQKQEKGPSLKMWSVTSWDSQKNCKVGYQSL